MFRDFISGVSIYYDGLNLRQKYPAKSSMLVFVSSTFTDTHSERNVLLEKILPALQDKGKASGVKTVFIDMRYGVRDENTLDHMTWLACKSELLKCLNESGSLAFLSLQSDKYGYRPIPKFIDQELFESRVNLTNTDNQVVLEWYKLDMNSIPPVYTLKNLIQMNDNTFWSALVPKVLNLFEDAAFDRESPELRIGRSVTEYEALTALSFSKDSSYSNMHWFHRHFEGGVSFEDDPNQFLDDAHDPLVKVKLQQLLDTMSLALAPKERVSRYQLPVISFTHKDDQWKEYITRWEERCYTVLDQQLTELIENKQSWDRDGYGSGVTGSILNEFIHHARWANIKCSTFHGRERLLNVCLSRVYEKTSSSCALLPGGPRKVPDSGEDNVEEQADDAEGDERKRNRRVLSSSSVCLAIIGVSGSGKTALMAKLAEKITAEDKNRAISRPVIFRFCGTTSDS